jgi:hypothetical protein
MTDMEMDKKICTDVYALFTAKSRLRFVRYTHVGRDSSVGIATGYGLDGPDVEFRWGRDFPHLSRPDLGPIQPPYNGYRVFPGVESGRSVTLTPHPFYCRVLKTVELFLYSP